MPGCTEKLLETDLSLCREAYRSGGWFDAPSLPSGFRMLGDFSSALPGQRPRHFGFAAIQGSTVTVAFRGTRTESEWQADALMALTPLNGYGKVHTGFLALYLGARNRILSLLASDRNARELRITGHSLGGAMAILLGVDLIQLGWKKPDCIRVFGSPRVGDPDFARTFDRHLPVLERVENECDPVVDLPPELFHLGRKTFEYRHAGQPRSFRWKQGNCHDLSIYRAGLLR